MTQKLWLVVACIVLSACQPTQTEDIRIGGLFALTSYGAQWGIAEHNGVVLAITQANNAGGINGRHLSLFAEDTQLTAVGTINAYNKLVHANNITLIIGPTWEESTSAVAPLAAEDRVLLITPSGYKSIPAQNATTLFSTYPPYEYQFNPLFDFAKKQNIERFAIIYNDEIFSAAMHELFVAAAKQQGLVIVNSFKMPPGNKDYRTELLKIKQSDAQAIYTPTEGNDLGTLMRQAHELGIQILVYSIDSAEGDDVLLAYGEVIEGLLYPYPVASENYAKFEADYQALFGTLPQSPSAATAYDAAQLVINALNTGATTAEEVAAYIHNVSAYPGASGTLTFGHDGIVQKKEYMLKTVRKGMFVPYYN